MSTRWAASDIPQRNQAEAAKQMYGYPQVVAPPIAVATCQPYTLVDLDRTKHADKRTASQQRFIALCEQSGIAVPTPEYRFHETRKWRFDWAWPEIKLACECDGGLYVNGGHSRGAAREHDYEKDAAAIILGWRVLRVSTGQLKSGLAIKWIKETVEMLRALGL